MAYWHTHTHMIMCPWVYKVDKNCQDDSTSQLAEVAIDRWSPQCDGRPESFNLSTCSYDEDSMLLKAVSGSLYSRGRYEGDDQVYMENPIRRIALLFVLWMVSRLKPSSIMLSGWLSRMSAWGQALKYGYNHQSGCLHFLASIIVKPVVSSLLWLLVRH